MGGVRLLLGFVCLWLPQIVGGASVVFNFYTDSACTEMFQGENPITWTQSADDKLCWNAAGGDSAKIKCHVDGKLDMQMWKNEVEGVTTPVGCTGTDSSTTETHLNGLDRADALTFLTGSGCFKQPTHYCDPGDVGPGGTACYMYAKLSAPLPLDAIPSTCTLSAPVPTPATGTKVSSDAVAKNILGVSGGLGAFLALWFWA